MLKVVIITVLAVQLVNTVAALVMSDEEKFVYVACGVPAIIVTLIKVIIEKIMKVYRRTHYKALLVDSEGRLCYCNSSDEPDELVHNGYEWPHDLTKVYSIEDGWKKDDCVMNTINLRYSPIKKVKELGAYEIKMNK